MCGNILRDIHGKTQQNICGEAVCQVRNRKLSFFPCGGGMCLGRVLLDLDETLCVCVCVCGHVLFQFLCNLQQYCDKLNSHQQKEFINITKTNYIGGKK